MHFEHIERRLQHAHQAMTQLRSAARDIDAAAGAIVQVLQRGGTVFTCGNGGSSAEALHLAEELIGNYSDRSRPPQRAIALAADPTALTCIANDFGFDEVFARPLRALSRSGDALVALSTSGRSANIIAALATARRQGVLTVGLLGRDGGPAAPLCDHAIVCPGADSAAIQECHLVVVHAICEAVEHAVGRANESSVC